MELNPLIVFVLAALALSFGSLALGVAYRRLRHRQLQTAVEALGGSARASAFSWATLTLGEGASRITLDCRFRRRHVLTKLSIPTAAPMPSFTIQVGMFSGSGSRHGIALGQVEAFDRLFIVETDDETSLRARLTPEVQRRLVVLARTGIAVGVYIACDGTSVTYERHRQLRGDELRETVPLVRRLAGHQSASTAFLDQGSPTATETA
jgi:hypothetical protein